MGMFNEVYKRCPSCGTKNEIQISDIVSGFGEFDLDDHNSDSNFNSLSSEIKREVINEIVDQNFHCDSCGKSYSPVYYESVSTLNLRFV